MRDFNSIIQEKVDEFLKFVKGLANSNQTHHNLNKSGGFPLFYSVDNRPFYEQSYFDQLIENSVWYYLVNGVLKELFSEEFCTQKRINCEWAYMHRQLTMSFVEDIERRYPIEFVLVCDGRRTAFRYTNCYYLEENWNKFFTKRNVDELIIIDFSSTDQSSFMHSLMIPEKYRSVVKIMPFKDFFTGYFSEPEYKYYTSEISKAISNVYKYIGLQTVSNLTLQHLPYFIEREIDVVRYYPYENKEYEIGKDLSEKASRWYGKGIISDADKAIIKSKFYENKRFLAMIGSEDFAHSFITSEYLYKTLKDNNQFDYTSIVSGYLKSIEQLLYKTILITLEDGHKQLLWIKPRWFDSENSEQFRRKGNRYQVKFLLENKKYFDTTFASMVHLLYYYKNGWSISNETIGVISALLLSYCDECRNEHFHKDNINDIKEVEHIRHNTFMLMYYILGAFDYSKSGQNENKILGIIDNTFDRMYRALLRGGRGNYYLLEFENGVSEFVAFPMSQEEPQYDENGVLLNARLRFVRVHRSIEDDWQKDNWHEIEMDNSAENTIILTPKNIPIHVKLFDKITRKITPITW